jgi:hypothetical protein
VAEWHVPGFSEVRTLGSGGFGELFRAEAAVLATVDDPNVVQLRLVTLQPTSSPAPAVPSSAIPAGVFMSPSPSPSTSSFRRAVTDPALAAAWTHFCHH